METLRRFNLGSYELDFDPEIFEMKRLLWAEGVLRRCSLYKMGYCDPITINFVDFEVAYIVEGDGEMLIDAVDVTTHAGAEIDILPILTIEQKFKIFEDVNDGLKKNDRGYNE